MDTEIRVSTESRPWRRKFSRRSCRDLNLRPIDHESGALTTELSLLPNARAITIRYTKWWLRGRPIARAISIYITIRYTEW